MENGKTTHELAEHIGLETYDTELPHDWFESVVHQTGWNPYGHIVWCYDKCEGQNAIFGYPVAVTAKGRYMLGMYASRVNS